MHPSGVAKSSTNFGWGKGSNVTYAGWQVTLCDPIWHVRSSSGVATSVSELLYPCYFIFTVFDGDLNPLRGVRARRRWERATPGGRVGRRTVVRVTPAVHSTRNSSPLTAFFHNPQLRSAQPAIDENFSRCLCTSTNSVVCGLIETGVP